MQFQSFLFPSNEHIIDFCFVGLTSKTNKGENDFSEVDKYSTSGKIKDRFNSALYKRQQNLLKFIFGYLFLHVTMLERFYKLLLPCTSIYEKNKPKIYGVFYLFTIGLNGLHQGLQQNILVLKTYSNKNKLNGIYVHRQKHN